MEIDIDFCLYKTWMKISTNFTEILVIWHVGNKICCRYLAEWKITIFSWFLQFSRFSSLITNLSALYPVTRWFIGHHVNKILAGFWIFQLHEFGGKVPLGKCCLYLYTCVCVHIKNIIYLNLCLLFFLIYSHKKIILIILFSNSI